MKKSGVLAALMRLLKQYEDLPRAWEPWHGCSEGPPPCSYTVRFCSKEMADLAQDLMKMLDGGTATRILYEIAHLEDVANHFMPSDEA